MISANLLVVSRRVVDTLDSRVHWEPWGSRVSIGRGRTQDSSIRACVYKPSSARIRQISDIGATGYSGALERRDNLSGALRLIPVNVLANTGGVCR